MAKFSSNFKPEWIARFREDWGDTFDNEKWPDWVIKSALCEAWYETGGSGWGNYGEECDNVRWWGLRYYGAHWLTANFGDGMNSEGLIVPSTARLNTAQKSVGDESIGYRVASMMDAGNDWLTYTVFGQQFYRMRRRIGMGARVSVIPVRAGHFH